MTTMATRNATMDTISHENAAKAIAQIESGLTDPFLRALYEAIVERRRVLTEDGMLPEQQRIQPAEVKYEVDHDMVDVAPTPQPMAVIEPPVAPARRRKSGSKVAGLGHVSARPTLTNTNLSPVMPLTRASWGNMDDTSIFRHGGLTYPKAEFKGHQVQGQTSHGDVIVFEISGVGDRSIKCRIVTEPPRGSVSGKTNLWEKWHANDPVFMPHSLIEPWLSVPADVRPYV